MKEKAGHTVCVLNIIEGSYTFCLFTGTSLDVVSVICGVLRPTSARVS